MKPTSMVYMAHPVAGDVAANLAKAKQWLRALQDANPTTVIIAPWITSCEIYDDDPEQRAAGILRSCYAIEKCSAIILVGGGISVGMEIEMECAIRAGVFVYDLTELSITANLKLPGFATTRI